MKIEYRSAINAIVIVSFSDLQNNDDDHKNIYILLNLGHLLS